MTNILRVFGLCLIAQIWGEEAVRGSVHDTSGYMVFILAFFLLYGLECLLRWRHQPPSQAPSPAAATPHAPAAPAGLRRRVVVTLLFLILCAGLSWRMLYPTLMEQGAKASQLPLNLGHWTGYD